MYARRIMTRQDRETGAMLPKGRSIAACGWDSRQRGIAGVKIDLALRDMGYFSLSEFTAIEQRGAVVSS